MVLDVLVGGLAGGLVATIVMSALMMVLVGDDPMPSQLLASKFINDASPEENQVLGMGLHVVYGVAMGLVLLALAAVGGFHTDVPGASAFGLLFGLLLWFGALFWMGILGILSGLRDEPVAEARKTVLGTLGMHLVYGLVAGLVGALVAGAM